MFVVVLVVFICCSIGFIAFFVDCCFHFIVFIVFYQFYCFLRVVLICCCLLLFVTVCLIVFYWLSYLSFDCFSLFVIIPYRFLKLALMFVITDP